MSSTDPAPVRKARKPGVRPRAAGAAPEDGGERSGAAASRQVVQPDKSRVLARLSRIDGQVRGVARMVEEDRYCLEVLTQLAAVKAALNQVAMQLLENHARGCVARAMRDGEGEAAMAELLAVLKRLDGKAFV